jgi:hypothetical protein
VQPRPVGQGRIDERRAEVDPPAGRLEHALDQVLDLARLEDRRGELRAAVLGDEDLARLVDPDLLDRGIVQIRLQRTQAGHVVEHLLDRRGHIEQGRQATAEGPLVIVADGIANERPHRDPVADRVDATPTNQLPDLSLDDVDPVAHRTPSKSRHGRPARSASTPQNVARRPTRPEDTFHSVDSDSSYIAPVDNRQRSASARDDAAID